MGLCNGTLESRLFPMIKRTRLSNRRGRVGRGTWVMGRWSEIPRVYTYVRILLCCFKCPLATEVLSAISF